MAVMVAVVVVIIDSGGHGCCCCWAWALGMLVIGLVFVVVVTIEAGNHSCCADAAGGRGYDRCRCRHFRCLFVGNGLNIERTGHRIGDVSVVLIIVDAGGWLPVGGSRGIRGAARDIGGDQCQRRRLIVEVADVDVVVGGGHPQGNNALVTVVQTWLRVRWW